MTLYEVHRSHNIAKQDACEWWIEKIWKEGVMIHFKELCQYLQEIYDSSVTKVTGYGLHDWGSVSIRVRNFSLCTISRSALVNT